MKADKKLFDEKTLNILKQHIAGFNAKEITTEYCLDEDSGKLKIVKQKVQEKSLPPNTDLIKILCQQIERPIDKYEDLTDEQLEKEKIRLLQELKEKESVSRKIKSKS